MVALRSRLSLLTGMGGAPSVTTRVGFSAMSREPSASALGDLRVTVRAFPPGQSPRTFHSSRSSCSVRLPGDSGVSPVRQGFYSPYFIVPKKGGGLRPILDLRVLNRALHRLPFKMLTHRRMIKCIQPRDWFAAIDLKDAYFHVSILPQTVRYFHRPFLRFASEGGAWQYRVLPFGLSLSPEGALAPLREVGIRILNCLEHGPRARTVMRSQGPGASAPQPVGALCQLGKEQALPCAENLFSWCGVRLGEYDGAPHRRARPISAELPEFLQRQDCGSSETVSEAPGAYGIRSCSHAAVHPEYTAAPCPSRDSGVQPVLKWSHMKQSKVQGSLLCVCDK